jgi:hypothetical protein
MTKMVVMKPFMAESGMLNSGDIVDASEFRNPRTLVSCRYLKPVDDTLPTPSTKIDPVVVEIAADGAEAEKPKRRTRKKNEG